MLVTMIAPSGVANGKPPANGLPPGAVWHAPQSPAIATYSPRRIRSAFAKSVTVWAKVALFESASAIVATLERKPLVDFIVTYLLVADLGGVAMGVRTPA